MKNFWCIIVVLFIIIAIHACHGNKSADNDAAKAQRHSLVFIKNSMVNGLCEIKASGLAITNSDNHRVIDLAKLIITEQTGIDSDLVQLKSTYHITVKDTITPYDARWIDSLSKRSGRAFDKPYLAAMVGIHRSDSVLFTLIAGSSKPDVKKFAGERFPLVKKQLDSTLAVSSSLK
jgi:putative membrane protein